MASGIAATNVRLKRGYEVASATDDTRVLIDVDGQSTGDAIGGELVGRAHHVDQRFCEAGLLRTQRGVADPFLLLRCARRRSCRRRDQRNGRGSASESLREGKRAGNGGRPLQESSPRVVIVLRLIAHRDPLLRSLLSE
jgi:hypothetical protein